MRGRPAALIAAAALVSVVAGCSDSADSTSERWTPSDLPSAAPEPQPLDARQRAAYDEAMARFDGPASDATARAYGQLPASPEARRMLAPFIAGPYLDDVLSGVDMQRSSGVALRPFTVTTIWRSPTRVTDDTIVVTSCARTTYQAIENGERLDGPVTDTARFRMTFRLTGQVWKAHDMAAIGDC